MLASHIFREYDIRGIADTELTDDTVHKIGRALGSFLAEQGKLQVGVGHDHRASSPRISKALTHGLMESGMRVILLGCVPTPLVYFAVETFPLDAGVCVTGSHNPPEFNGLKIQLSGAPFFGAQIQGLKDRILAKNFKNGVGSVKEDSTLIEKYQKYVSSLFNFKKKLHVILDTGHGMAGNTAPRLIQGLGHQVQTLYENLDSTFPDHHPDPSDLHNMRDLQRTVLEKKADIGMAFDGDADRIGVVSEKGEIIFGDQLTLIYAREIASRKPGAVIIGDVKCSKQAFDLMTQAGAKPMMWKTGHSLVKAKMKETGAELAGEMSGHIFFKDRWFGFDDAIYSACRILEILDKTGKKVSELLSDYPKMFSTPELRVDCPDAIKFQVVEQIKKKWTELNRPVEKFKMVEIDGVRAEWKDGWGLVRASNTQPVLVTRFEAASDQRAKEIQTWMEKEIYDAIQKDGFYVRVPSGKQFYLYVLQTIDRADAEIGGSEKPFAEATATGNARAALSAVPPTFQSTSTPIKP